MFKHFKLQVFNTIQTRLSLASTLLVALIALFVYIYFPKLFDKESKEIFIQKSDSFTEMTAYSISPALFFEDMENIETVINTFIKNRDVIFITLYGAQNNIIYESEFDSLNYTIQDPKQMENHTILNDILYVKQPVLSNQTNIGELILGFSLSSINKELFEIKEIVAMISIVIFVVGLLIAYILSSIITDPLNNMVKIFDEISNGNLEKKAPIYSSKEIHEMGRAFNKMVKQLDHAQKELSQANLNLEKKVTIRTIALQNEIQERKRIEKEIKASLKEKEVLLKEVHHRVKNNLQIILSLTYLQTKNIKDQYTLSVIKENNAKIRSIALIHELLYKSNNLTGINLAEYFKDLIFPLHATYKIHVENINIQLDNADIWVDIDTAIPCGLVINELVSNSFKHAFKDKKDDCTISMSSSCPNDKTLEIKYHDNGSGFAPNIDTREPKTLGLQLIKVLVENQLSGKLEFNHDDGTHYTITIPLPSKK